MITQWRQKTLQCTGRAEELKNEAREKWMNLCEGVPLRRTLTCHVSGLPGWPFKAVHSVIASDLSAFDMRQRDSPESWIG